MSIRIAKSTDAASILSIYAPYVLNTAITFETALPSIKEFEQRIITCLEIRPWIVFETDGIIAGYAYAAKHRERSAYQWCVESSVYVSDHFQKKGIATSLYTTLFKVLKYQGFINVYAGITLPNDKSIGFHKKFGFTKIAEYTNIGYKLNKWNSVSWWQLQLNDYSGDPSAPIKFPDVDDAFINSILK